MNFLANPTYLKFAKEAYLRLLTGRKKKKKTQTTVWCDHIHMIVPLHTMNRYHFWFSIICQSSRNIKWYLVTGCWALQRLCPALWVSIPCDGCTTGSGATLLPSQDAPWAAAWKTASLCVHSLYVLIYVHVLQGRHTLSAGVSIVCAQSQPSTLRGVTTAARSQSCRVYTPRGTGALEVIHPRPPPGTLCSICSVITVLRMQS